MVTEFLPGVLHSAAAVPRHDRRRAQGAGPVQHRAAGRIRRQHGHPRSGRGHDALRAGARAGRAAVDRRFPRRRRATARSISPRSRPPTGIQHHGRRDQGQAARHAAHRDAELVDHHGLRPGPEQGLGRRPRRRPSSSCPSSARSRPRQAAKLMADRLRLPRLAGGQRQEGHPLPQPEERAATSEDMERPAKETQRYYVTHVKDADLNKAMDDASLAMIKFLETEEEDRAPRRLWPGERGDGLPRRRGVRDREERPLPDAEEPLAKAAMTRRHAPVVAAQAGTQGCECESRLCVRLRDRGCVLDACVASARRIQRSERMRRSSPPRPICAASPRRSAAIASRSPASCRPVSIRRNTSRSRRTSRA